VTHSIGLVVSEVEPLPPLAAALVELSLRLDIERELDRLVSGAPGKRKR